MSLGSKVGITSELSKLIFFVQTFAIINVCFDSVNEFFQRVIVGLRPEEPHHNHRQHFPVQIPAKLVDNVSLHGSLLVVVEGVHPHTHHHVVHGAAVHLGEPEVDSSNELLGQFNDHILPEICGGEAEDNFMKSCDYCEESVIQNF